MPLDAPWLATLRIHHWAKNLLLFVPLVLAHQALNLDRIASVGVAFLSFCATASGTYLLNDALDLESDRQHPEKRVRPLASGAIPVRSAVLASAALLALGFGTSLALLPLASTAMLVLYVAVSGAYSLALKRYLLLDVIALAGLYTLRVLAGAVAASVEASAWLLAFSTFFFLSLAFVKRFVELRSRAPEPNEQLAGRGYRGEDTAAVEIMGISAGFISVLVLGLYVTSDDVARLYRVPQALWAVAPIMLYWISRIWLLARRGALPHDPVLFATSDGVSYVAGAAILVVGVAASW